MTTAPLFEDDNGRITCLRHRPSSDFHSEPLNVPTIREWTRFVEERYGAGSHPCEECRHRQAS